MARVIAVCTSKDKGVVKEPVAAGIIQQDYGILGDAHAGYDTHRQVSLLAVESIRKIRGAGLDVNPGDFAENITTEGIALSSVGTGAKISVGEGVVLEVTQIGKECHAGCAIFRQTGKCIMPKKGVFARVITGGLVRAGDSIEIVAGGEIPGRISRGRDLV